MAALSHGRPLVTTEGLLTEDIWRKSDAVSLVRAGDVPGFIGAVEALLAREEERSEKGLRAKRFYLDHFDVRHTIAALRAAREVELACAS